MGTSTSKLMRVYNVMMVSIVASLSVDSDSEFTNVRPLLTSTGPNSATIHPQPGRPARVETPPGV